MTTTATIKNTEKRKSAESCKKIFDKNSLALIASNNTCNFLIANQVELLDAFDTHVFVADIREY